MPIILVTGATGKQGSAVISHLLRSPLRPTIRALTRSPTSPASLALAGKGVQLVKGSLDDRASLVKALEGAESAFLVNADSPVELEQGKTFISVAKDVGLGFLVYASAEGAGASPPALHKKLAIEEALKTSGLRFTILRPVAFFENLPSEPGVMRWLTLAVMDSALKGKRLQMVATDDIGELSLDCLSLWGRQLTSRRWQVISPFERWRTLRLSTVASSLLEGTICP